MIVASGSGLHPLFFSWRAENMVCSTLFLLPPMKTQTPRQLFLTFFRRWSRDVSAFRTNSWLPERMLEWNFWCHKTSLSTSFGCLFSVCFWCCLSSKCLWNTPTINLRFRMVVVFVYRPVPSMSQSSQRWLTIRCIFLFPPWKIELDENMEVVISAGSLVGGFHFSFKYFSPDPWGNDPIWQP